MLRAMALVMVSSVMQAGGTTTAPPHSSFDGTWIRNYEKSDVPSMRMKITDAGNGRLRFDDANTLKTDGTKTRTADGGESALEKMSDRSFHETDWFDGKEASQADYTLSDDDRTLTLHQWDTDAEYGHTDRTTTFSRVAGELGLVGDWKSTSVKDRNPRIWVVKVSDKEVVWNEPGINLSVRAPTNATPVHPQGPAIPDSMTMAYTRTGPRTLHMVEHVAGKTVLTVTYTVSEDGNTLSVVGKDGKGETTKGVWDKQRQ